VNYRVVIAPEAGDDLERLFEYLLERELNSEAGDMTLPERAINAIRRGLELLAHTPFSCRKAAASNPFVRELVIPFGHSGYVALFEVLDAKTVVVAAVRHQREGDYH
jgi:plasmid stabilization system protein ParE